MAGLMAATHGFAGETWRCARCVIACDRAWPCSRSSGAHGRACLDRRPVLKAPTATPYRTPSPAGLFRRHGTLLWQSTVTTQAAWVSFYARCQCYGHLDLALFCFLHTARHALFDLDLLLALIGAPLPCVLRAMSAE